MLDILLPTLLLVAIGAAINSVVRQSSALGRLKSELPIHRRSLSSASASRPWTIERSGLSLSISTTGLNSIPGQILLSGRRDRDGLKRGLLLLYNIGTVFGVVGGVGAIASTTWQLVEVWGTVWLEISAHAAQKGEVGKIVKRAFEDVSSIPVGNTVAPSMTGLQPLIPGVTLPLRHLPTLVLALVVNQLIHELGHALSAALEDIPLSSFSLNFHFFLPSMAVHLPPSVDYLPARSKMRLASSGPLHNLITYGWLLFLAFSGAGSFLWKDRGDVGRVVQAVSSTSPLYRHISPGRIITYLDESPMGGDADKWSQYLQDKISDDVTRGWCIDQSTFAAMPDSPCIPQSGKVAFSASSDSSGKCLDPNPILYTPSVNCPCPGADQVCVRPLRSERILRVRLDDGSTENGEVVLWQGDRSLVMRDVKVGREGARFLGPVVRWGTIFFEYLTTIALSLFLFNLLPLPHTDGSQLLQSLLSLSKSPSSTFSLRSSRSHPLTRSRSRSRNSPMINIRYTAAQQYDLGSDSDDGYSYDTEDRSGRGGREEAWKKRFRRGIEIGCVGLAVGWVAGWAMLALLRSS